jgi:small subunit ribosomal protein S16
MSVKIRLTRMGKKKQPSYRVVVMDSRRPRDGAYIEQIGTYDPRRQPSLIEIDNDKAVDWLRKGAQPTDRARKLLEISGAWTRFRVAKGDIHTIGHTIGHTIEHTTDDSVEPAVDEPADEPVAEAAPELVDEAATTEGAEAPVAEPPVEGPGDEPPVDDAPVSEPPVAEDEAAASTDGATGGDTVSTEEEPA